MVAFAAGLGSLLSPCVIPLIPSYLSAMGGGRLTDTATVSRVRWTVLVNAIGFISGFSAILVLSGLLATRIGMFVHLHQHMIAQIGGVLIVVFGLQTLGVVQFGLFNREWRLVGSASSGRTRRFAGAIGLGVIFAAGWTPCVGPIWASILIMASQAHSVSMGGFLLFMYAMGMALPLLILAIFLGQAVGAVRNFKAFVPVVERVTGILLVALGVALFTGWYAIVPSLL